MALRCVRTGFTLAVDEVVTHSDLFFDTKSKKFFACGMAQQVSPHRKSFEPDATLDENGYVFFSLSQMERFEENSPYIFSGCPEGIQPAKLLFISSHRREFAIRLHGLEDC